MAWEASRSSRQQSRISSKLALTSPRDSPANAERFIEALARECQKLADSPFVLGRPCEGLHPELRRHNYKRYAIIYRPVPDGIEMVGVFQGSRQLEAVFELFNERLAERKK